MEQTQLREVNLMNITHSKEVKMRKNILLVLIAIVSVLLFSQGTSFAISGVCYNCHTMHNSQNGAPMAYDYLGAADSTPNDNLLISDCIGCHSTTSATEHLSTAGGPAVLHTVAPSAGYTLAGGDFYWARSDTNIKGHNVTDIPGMANDAILSAPPGYDAAATSGYTFDGKTMAVSGLTNVNFTCAGTYGCHGTRNAAGIGGITGSHHSNTGGTSAAISSAPTTVGGSYRFLAGIMGKEDVDWQYTAVAATDHNEYYGVDGNVDYANKNTISYFCGECHGAFHSAIGGPSSPWERHPTDIALPNKTEYAAYTSYSLEAPVARPLISGVSGTVVPGGAAATGGVVMCLSCHRAHGSDQPDLLRWNYDNMVAGGTSADTGCFTCHTTKNVAP
jgi:predicted CXXCH cytochrome family protein